MRIDRIRVGYAPVPMRPPMRTAIHQTTHTHNALVEIAADGVTGQGAALTLTAGQGLAVCRMLEEFAGLLHGRNPRDIRALSTELRQQISLTGQSGLGMLALSAIDTALWDLHARAADLPVYRVLGGTPTALPVYAQPDWLSLTPEQLVTEALAVQERGFGHYKMRVGSPDWRRDLDRVSRVRDALDPATQLLVDANQGWTRLQALAATRAPREWHRMSRMSGRWRSEAASSVQSSSRRTPSATPTVSRSAGRRSDARGGEVGRELGEPRLQVVEVHARAEGHSGLTAHEQGFGDGRDLRCVGHVEDEHHGAVAVVRG